MLRLLLQQLLAVLCDLLLVPRLLGGLLLLLLLGVSESELVQLFQKVGVHLWLALLQLVGCLMGLCSLQGSKQVKSVDLIQVVYSCSNSCDLLR